MKGAGRNAKAATLSANCSDSRAAIARAMSAGSSINQSRPEGPRLISHAPPLNHRCQFHAWVGPAIRRLV